MDKIQAIRNIRKNIFIKFGIVDLINGQVDNPDCVSDHRLWMVGELLRHDQKREMFVLLIIEELNGVLIQQQGQRLNEGHVNIHQLLIIKVEVELNQFVEEWMAQNVIPLSLLRYVLQEDACGLN